MVGLVGIGRGNRSEPSLRREARAFVLFLVSGLISTGLNFTVFLGLLIFSSNVVIAASVGHIAGIVLSFNLNNSLSFKGFSGRPKFSGYLLFYIVSGLVQVVLLKILVEMGHSPALINATIIASFAVLNFFSLRFLFYRV